MKQITKKLFQALEEAIVKNAKPKKFTP